MAGPDRIKNSFDNTSGRRPNAQGPDRAAQAREARLAEALRANLRKRKAQAKAQNADAKSSEKGPKSGS